MRLTLCLLLTLTACHNHGANGTPLAFTRPMLRLGGLAEPLRRLMKEVANGKPFAGAFSAE